VRTFIIVSSQNDLPESVDAIGTSRRLARRLHRGQEQGDEHADDGDHHQQLDQREAM
jgi:hypothetical protein